MRVSKTLFLVGNLGGLKQLARWWHTAVSAIRTHSVGAHACLPPGTCLHTAEWMPATANLVFMPLISCLLLGILYPCSYHWFDVCFWESCTRVRTIGLMSASENPVHMSVQLVSCLLLGILYPCSYHWFHVCFWESCTCVRTISFMSAFGNPVHVFVPLVWHDIALIILPSFRWVDVCFWGYCLYIIELMSAIYNPIFISLGWRLFLWVLSSYHWVDVCHL